MPLQTIAGRTAQFAIAKQSAQGTTATFANTGTTITGTWFKWRQGSAVYPKMEVQHDFEGDGNRGEALAYKKLQYGYAKYVTAPRPSIANVFLGAFSGAATDALNCPGYATLSAPVTGGTGVSFSLGNAIALPGSVAGTFPTAGTRVAVINADGSAYEITTVATITPTGSTSATGTATFANAHPTGAFFFPLVTHTLTPSLANKNTYYTLLAQLPGALSSGTNTYYETITDAQVTSLTLAASANDPILKMDAEFIGIASGQGSNATPYNYYYYPDGPYYFFSLNGSGNGSTITLPVSTASSNVVLPVASIQGAIRDISIKFEQEITPGDFQTTSITPINYNSGNVMVTGDMTVLWQDGGIAAYAYFGGASNTGDSATLPTGQVALTFACASDATQVFQLNLPNCAFETAEFEPDLSGKPIEQKLTFHALRYPQAGGGATPLYTATISNFLLATTN